MATIGCSSGGGDEDPTAFCDALEALVAIVRVPPPTDSAAELLEAVERKDKAQADLLERAPSQIDSELRGLLEGSVPDAGDRRKVNLYISLNCDTGTRL